MIPVCKPFWGYDEEQAALRVMRSGRLICGPEVAKFEQMVAERVGVKYAVATSSGTTALHLALLAMGVGQGDEVLVPAFTFVATANAVMMTGAKVKLCDIKLDTFGMDVLNLPTGWSAAVPVLPFGYPFELATNWGAKILHDAACGLGTEFNFVDTTSIFSFHATKVITTGEGGMVVTNDETLASDVRWLRDQKHGQGLAYNFRMTEMQGAIGQEQMGKLDTILARRAEIAARYDYCFDGKIGARIPPKGGNYQSYVLLLDGGFDRASAIAALAAAGVEALPGTQYLGDMPHLKVDPETLPNAYWAGQYAMRIPLYPGMTDEEVQFVIIKVKDVLG